MKTGTQPSETGAIVLDPADDVAVLIAGVEAGAFVKVSGPNGPLSLTVRQTLPMGRDSLFARSRREVPCANMARSSGASRSRLQRATMSTSTILRARGP